MSHVVRSHRALWQSVMMAAIMDATKTIKSRALICGHSRAVAIEMIYFHSADWSLLCEMAGMSSKPDEIEAFLRSDLATKTQAQIYRSFGLTNDRQEVEAA